MSLIAPLSTDGIAKPYAGMLAPTLILVPGGLGMFSKYEVGGSGRVP